MSDKKQHDPHIVLTIDGVVTYDSKKPAVTVEDAPADSGPNTGNPPAPGH